MPTTDGLINSRNLCSQAVVERVLRDASVSSVKIANNIQSDNFVTGVSGWRIERNTGSAEFQDVVVRGTLNADDIVAGTLDASVVNVTNLNASNITTGTLSADRIAANSLAVDKISGGTYGNSDITFSSGSDLVSSNYNDTPGAEAGWKIQGNGDAFLNDITARGTIYATAGELGGLDIDGTLTLVSGGKFQTSSGTGQHIVIEQVVQDTIYWRNGATNKGFIALDTDDTFFIASAANEDLRLIGGTSAEIHFNIGGTPSGTNYMKMDTTNFFSATTSGAQVRHLAGSDSNPSFTFVGDGDTGMYRYGTDVIGFTAAGTARVTLGGFGLRALVGSAGTPAYSFILDTDTGMFRGGTNELGFSTSGTQRMLITTGSGVYVTTGSAATGNPRIFPTPTSATTPNYSFYGDTDTGMYRSASNQCAIATGGTVRWFADSNGTHVPNGLGSASAANTAWLDTGNSNRLRYDSSTRRHKQNITYDVDYLADYPLRPARYKHDGDETETYGLIAEDIADADPLLGYRGADGEIENYYKAGFYAIVAAKLNRLEAAVGL